MRRPLLFPVMPTPRRTSPAPGIRWSDRQQRWKVSTEIGTGSRQDRRRKTALFPATASLKEMQRWQEATRVALRAALDDTQARTPSDTPATLDDACRLYQPVIDQMPNRGSYAPNLAAWRRALGHACLDAWPARDVRVLWTAWEARYSPHTLNHRRQALLDCLTTVAPHAVDTVSATVPHTRPPKSLPRELPYATVQRILAAMPDTKAAAFLRVMAETGLPPATLRRLTRESVDTARATMTLPPRAKGATAAARVLPLTPAAVRAFQHFDRVNAWAGVTGTTLGLVWRRACAAVRAGAYPPTTPRQSRGTLGEPYPVPACSPYILRHSFAGRVLDATHGDVQALKELLQHEDLATSLRYVEARVQRSTRAAVNALAALDPDHGSRPSRKQAGNGSRAPASQAS